MTDLSHNIEKIAKRTLDHPELQQAHHFLYDLRHPRGGQPTFVVMGVNPGETPYAWQIAPSPTEESSRFDFHAERGSGRSSLRWSKAANYFLEGADYVLTELFFWSSSDSRQFVERFGRLASSPHLPFCTALNRDLIDAYQPEAVVVPGLTNLRLVQSHYGLRHLHQHRHEGRRVAELLTDGKRPWVFTKHWTAAFGFSTAQREVAREAIRNAVG